MITFLAPLYLLGLLAAPLPVIIHILQRRRARVMEWSSLRFLESRPRPRTRRLDLRQLLLLAVRVLALILLALALARPSLPGEAAGAGAPTDAVIALDASMSMRARSGTGGAGTLFDRARERAGEVVDLMREGDRAAILLAGTPGSAGGAAPRLLREAGAVRAELQAADAGWGSANWGPALAEGRELLRDSPTANREIYLVSDFQANEWSDSLGAAVRRLAAEGIRLYPVPVGPPPRENLAVEEVRAERAGGSAGTRASLRALVRNHGDRAAARIGVAAHGEDGASAAALADVPAADAVWVTLEIAAPPPAAFFAGRVEIVEDAQAGDDVRHVALGPRVPPKVLLIGRPSAGAGAGWSSDYLARALAPGESGERYAVVARPAGEVTAAEIAAADVVVLADCGRLAPAPTAAARERVAAGAGLLVFLGPATDAGHVNRELFAGSGALRCEGSPAPRTELGWGRIETRHPVFAVFAPDPARALAAASFSPAVRLAIGAGEGGGAARALAHFSNGWPALVELRHGEGRILVFAASPDRDGGSFPLTGNFLPFAHEAVGYLAARGEESPAGYLVGETARREPASAGAGGVSLLSPDGRSLPLLPEAAAGRLRFTAGPLDEPGLWRLRRGETTIDLFACNPDPRESDPACLDPATVAARLGAAALVEGGGARDLASAVRAARYGREIAGALLWLAFALLMAELALRGGFALPGRPAREARTP